MSYKAFYENHIELLKKNDVNLLVENDYHDDAVMILMVGDEPQVIEGKDALKGLLGGYMEFIYRGYLSTEKYAETGDSLFFEATIKTTSGTSQIYDALVMKDGKIFRHFSGSRGTQRDPLGVSKIEKGGGVTLHCLASGEDGEMANAVIIETARSLVVVDTMNLLPYARELRAYADALGKPIDRVLITHAHPDHWFGIECFPDVPTMAFPETRADIEAKGDFFLASHRTMHGEKEAAEVLPAKKVVPAQDLEEGTISIDGLEITLTKVRDAEYGVMLAIEIPSLKTLVAQDLVYSRTYLFVGERSSTGDHCFDGWIKVLRAMKAKGFETVIPGHGEPGGAELLDENIEYLESVKEMFAAAADGEDFKARIKARYPDHRVPLMLAMSNYFLYDMAKAQE
jgi:glyoxylase-like metal-dependent hydrolase (beta-lactamase superfamily II)